MAEQTTVLLSEAERASLAAAAADAVASWVEAELAAGTPFWQLALKLQGTLSEAMSGPGPAGPTPWDAHRGNGEGETA